MPLREKFSVPYSSPQKQKARHAMQGHMGKHWHLSGGRKEKRGQHRPWPLSRLLRERQSKAE